MQKHIEHLRSLYSKYAIDAYVIPSSDEFQNEYPPQKLNRLLWITGFSYSNGVLIISKDTNIFFTDARYLLQAKEEIGKYCEILDMYKPGACKIIGDVLNGGSLGYDPMLHTIDNLKYYETLASRYNFSMKRIDTNLVDIIRCAGSNENIQENSDITIFGIEYAGESHLDKLNKLTAKVETSLDYIFVTRLDSICWLLNIRGNAVPYTPFPLAYLLLGTKENTLTLFVDDITKAKLALLPIFGDNLTILHISQIQSEFSKLLESGAKIQLDPSDAASLFLQNTNKCIIKEDPIQLMKAVKNEVEIDGFKKAHLYEGIAVTEFLAWISSNPGISEFEASQKLLEFRAQNKEFLYPSFETISAYGKNAAIVHYKPSLENSSIIEESGLYLVDSGGQYYFGTTDVTRTICIGKPQDEHKVMFTLVLKGHIRLARAVFPENTRGSQLDSLARFDLWQHGCNYRHGTGHGVGHFLSVHEGPQSISSGKKIDVALQAGMVLSNEPGFYKDGEYGIRIENMLLVIPSKHTGYLEFQNLTAVPIAYDLVDFNMLEQYEKEWLQNYNKTVYNLIGPFISDQAKKYFSGLLIDL